MSNHQGKDASAQKPVFATNEGLRQLLLRLSARPEAWRQDPEARALSEYVTDRYARLCRKWGRDPSEAAVAAFHAMQGDYILGSEKPWGVVTVAVRAALIAETMSERLLISPERARQEDVSVFDRPVRAGGHEEFLYDVVALAPWDREPASPLVSQAQAVAVRFLVALRWEPGSALTAVEYIFARFIAAANIDRAYRYLRMDETGPTLLDMPKPKWRELVRIMIGSSGEEGVPGKRGLFARIVVELEGGASQVETIYELLRDDQLIIALHDLRPEA